MSLHATRPKKETSPWLESSFPAYAQLVGRTQIAESEEGKAATSSRLHRRRHRIRRQARQQRVQRGQGRVIGDAVDAGRAEMTLEGGDHLHGGTVIFA